MKCRKCGYEGPAEVGDYGKHPDLPWVRMLYRCPECKSTNVRYIHADDHLEAVIKFDEECRGPERPHEPVKKQILLDPPLQLGGFASYLIYCPYCGWGEEGGLSKEGYDRARAVMVAVKAK